MTPGKPAAARTRITDSLGAVFQRRGDGSRGGRSFPRASVIVCTTIAAVSALGLALSFFAIVITLGDLRPHRIALDLQEHGVIVAVRDVVPHPDSRGQGRVDVTFEVGRELVTTRAVGGDGNETSDDPTGVAVIDEPGNPSRAMLVEDVEYYAEDAIAGGVSRALIFASPAALTILLWLLFGRPPWWPNVSTDWL